MKEVDKGNGKDRTLQDRLEKLSGAIEKKRSESESKGQTDREGDAGTASTGRAMALGFRILAELVAGVLVGVAIGWQLDRWSGWSPVFLIVFMMLGIAAGFWNIMKAVNVKLR